MADFESLVYRIGVEPHPNADRLDLAAVGDYRCVVGKGSFKDGDLAAYIPEVSIVPDDVIVELGLEGRLSGNRKNRVKAAKLRGVVSQGLVYPVDGYRLAGLNVVEGDDVTDALGLEKYEPAIPAQMQGKWKSAGETGPYFGRLLKYDIENVKKYPNVIENGEPVVFTEKLHGTWCCFAWLPGEGLVVTSKGLSKRGVVLDLDNNEGNLYVDAFHRVCTDLCTMVDMASGMPPDEPVFILGEVYGSGVQDLAYGTSNPEFRVFDIRIGGPSSHEGFWLHTSAAIALTAHTRSIEYVPVLYEGPFSRSVLDEYTTGTTVLGGGNIREGVVVRPLYERSDPKLGRVILKSVSDAYLLRKGGTELA